MNPSELLGRTFACECGKTHSVPIREIIYSESAVQDAAGVFSRYFRGKTTVIIADQRTFAAAGKALNDALAAQGWYISNLIVPDGKNGREPVCDDFTLDYVLNRLPKCDFYIAAGAGVISDLTKWAACKTGKPYAALATAASMNGYSSANIAPTVKGVKRLMDGVCPLVIMAVPSVINQAPYKLTAAGLGDVLAKPVSITDWRMSKLLFGEYFCPLCARMISEIEPAYMDNPGGILQKKPEAIGALFNALVYSGLSMTIAGTSSPSSGGEHMISHALDSTALARGLGHDYHGRQVGLGTIFACALYERILALEAPQFTLRAEPVNAAFWQSLAPVVEEEYARKTTKAARAVEQLKKKNCWDELRALAKQSIRTPAGIRDCLKTAGAAYRIADIGCDRARFLEAALNCHQMRERYTVIDLARAVGIMPKAANEIIEEYLA
ncbi:MAG: iron-containing alcohol dehydrogenase [Kiritimatiellae bacterium]|nr:iron-containing alcohol dehydrogenase [Kiritimatiellia bacterium]